MLLNNQWITEEIKRNKKYLETDENESTRIQNTAEVLRGELVVAGGRGRVKDRGKG